MTIPLATRLPFTVNIGEIDITVISNEEEPYSFRKTLHIEIDGEKLIKRVFDKISDEIKGEYENIEVYVQGNDHVKFTPQYQAIVSGWNSEVK